MSPWETGASIAVVIVLAVCLAIMPFLKKKPPGGVVAVAAFGFGVAVALVLFFMFGPAN